MKIAISGCGVAGPTLAYWLKKYGHEPVIFEIAPALRTGGYLIDFWGLGYKIAKKMGILPALKDKAYFIQNLIVMDRDDKSIVTNDIATFSDAMGGDYLSIKRGDLAEIVFNSLEGVKTHFGVFMTAIAEHESGVNVTFSNGKSERFDFVIGADGLHSQVRNLAFGPEDKFERDLGIYVAAFTAKNYPHRDELSYIMYPQVGRQIARTSLHDDETVFFFAFKKSLISGTLLTEAMASKDDAEDALRAVYENDGWESRKILSFLDKAEDFYFDSVSQIEMPHWTKGRVALVGDAAACASLLAGEGTGLGMTEAYVLAGELHKAGNDYRAAFKAYENELQGFLRKKQRTARRFMGVFVPKSELAMRMSRLGLRASSIPLISKPIFTAMYSDKIKLKDYNAG